MRVGVIGMGRMGRTHAEILAEHSRVTELVVANRTRAGADEVARELDARAAELDELFSGVDAVVIATATNSHPELIERAVSAGLATFCEKPIALDMATTERIVALVAARGAKLHVGFHRRFDPGHAAARRLVESGGLGIPYIVRTLSHDHAPSHESFIPTSGGIFRDLVIHDIDAARYVTGQEVVRVHAEATALHHDVYASHDDFDVATVNAVLSEGTRLIMSATRHDPAGHDVRMELYGPHDSVVVGWDDRTPLRSLEQAGRSMPDDTYRDFIDRFRSAYAAQMDAFVRFAAGERPNPASPADALRALEIVEACEQSVAAGAAVDV